MFSRAVVLFVLVAVFAKAALILKEKGTFDGRLDYIKSEVKSLDEVHDVVFAVKQRNLDALEKILFEVSDPDSPKYGKHLSRAEVADLTANAVATDYVINYLKREGVEDVKKTLYGEYITARAPLALWQKVFSTTFYAFKHAENKSSKEIYRASEYSLDSELDEHLTAVFNTVHLPPIMVPKKALKRKYYCFNVKSKFVLICSAEASRRRIKWAH